jgi:putative sugar O-methyltransferase
MIKKLLRKLIISLFLERSQSNRMLQQVKSYQLELFDDSFPRVQELRDEMREFDGPHIFIDENWDRWSKQILELYEDKKLLWEFSRHPIIKKTMTAEPVRSTPKDLVRELSYANKRHLLEELIGDNLLNNRHLATSSSRLGHLYILDLIESNLLKLSYKLENIVEIGGGFGGLASLFLRKYGVKYKIFDLWQMLPLQYSYLTTVLGDSARGTNDLSLSPVQSLDARSSHSALFISNWALTESTAAMQRFVIDNDFLGADIAIVCCEDNNSNHKDSKHIHDYLVAHSTEIYQLKYGLSDSKMYVIDLR